MHTYITYVADRAATREVEALADFFALGQLVKSGELKYDTAKTQLVEAFDSRGLSASTAKTYLSQGHSLAQLFDDFDAVEEYADEVCNGSRSLKKVYDSTKVKVAPTPKVVAPATPLVDVILANLANLVTAADITAVRDAAEAMLARVIASCEVPAAA